MFFGKKKLIGLDIGTSSIKVAEIDVSRKKTVLNSFSIVPTPAMSMSSDGIVDPQSLAEGIRRAIHESQSKRKLVSSGLWGSSVIVKRISIPRMDVSLVSEQIRWEAEQYIPYDINEVTLEFKVLEGINNSEETMDILLVAAVQETILKYAEVIEMSGLNCSVLDVEGFALANCFEKNYGLQEGHVTGILNVGSNVTNFVVIDKSEVIFCRDIPVGGGTYSIEIQKAMGLNPDESEALKLSVSRGEPAPDEAMTIIDSTHDLICDEINSSLEFFLNTSQSQKLTQFFVSGGGARVIGLNQKLTESFGCQPMNPFQGLEINPKTIRMDILDQVHDVAPIAIGLALRGVDDE